MVSIVKLFNSAFKKGFIAIVQKIGKKRTTGSAYYSPHGLFGLPPDGIEGLKISLVNSNSGGIIIATNNQKINIDVGQGGTALYCTDKDNNGIKATILLKNDGFVSIENNNNSIILNDNSIEISSTSSVKINGNLEVLP